MEPGEVSYYLARGGPMNDDDDADLVVIGQRGDGGHLGVVLPGHTGGLDDSLEGAAWFELGEQRATDVVGGADQGLVVAGLAGDLTVVPAGGGEPMSLALAPTVPSPLIDVAPFEGDPRLLVAGLDRVYMQDAIDDETVGLHVVGETAAEAVFIDVLLRPQEDPTPDTPYVGVVDGRDLALHELIATSPPQVGLDRAGVATLDDTPVRALWRHVEGSAQVLAFAAGSDTIDWYRVYFDGGSPISTIYPIPGVDEILDVLPVQLDANQEELVVLGLVGGRLIVVTYLDALGVEKITLTNGTRSWAAPVGVDGVPLLAAAELASDDDDGTAASEIVLVEPSGVVRCLDMTEVALVESCGQVDLSGPSTSGRRGW